MQGEKSHERPFWNGVSGEWRPLFGSFRQQGVSVEWHDFECERTLEWSRSFHPDSLEICLNLEGCGVIRQLSAQTTAVNPRTLVHYQADPERLRADRQASQRHRFLTVEMSRDWLGAAMQGHEDSLSREARRFLGGSVSSASVCELPLDARLSRAADEMRSAPLPEPATGLWFHAKILEIASYALTSAPREELFCERQKRVALERVERVKQRLSVDLENPPSLAELGREVGCSPFYLSRIFSEQTGLTISRYLRNLRLERASELLRSGRCNVTEAAMAVGYSSLSHFSKAFAEMYGSCPCAFPLKGGKSRSAG